MMRGFGGVSGRQQGLNFIIQISYANNMKSVLKAQISMYIDNNRHGVWRLQLDVLGRKILRYSTKHSLATLRLFHRLSLLF